MANDRIKILLVEDDAQDARLLMLELSGECTVRSLIHCAVTHVRSLAEAIARAAQESFDLLLLDLSLPDSSGLETLERAQAAMPAISIVVLTGLNDDEVGIAALRKGASNYLVKGKVGGQALVRAARFAIEQHALYETLRERTAELEREIAERFRSEAALRESERRYRELIEQSLALICTHDLNGVLKSVNPAGAAALGYSAEELVGLNLADFIAPAFRPRFPEYLRRVAAENSDAGILKVVDRVGEERVWDYRNMKCDESGREPYVLGCALDVTERMRAEQERGRYARELDKARREQLEMKDQFLSNVSHELRSPLAVIYQFTTILADEIAGGVNPEQREYLGIMLRNIKQLTSMIDDLLEVTRVENSKLKLDLQPVDAAGLIKETISSFGMQAAEKGLALHCDDFRASPMISADPLRIRQVLGNLIGNAIKFTPEGGSIEVSAAVCDSEPFLRISVVDTGCGVSPEGLPFIFERLYQDSNRLDLSRKGLGLGLHICKQLVSLHGGRIWAESEEGRGSTFSFTTPLAHANGNRESRHGVN